MERRPLKAASLRKLRSGVSRGVVIAAATVLQCCGGRTDEPGGTCDRTPGTACGDRICYQSEDCCNSNYGGCVPNGAGCFLIDPPVIKCGTRDCRGLKIGNGGYITQCCINEICGLSRPFTESGLPGECDLDVDPALVTTPPCGSYEACVADQGACSQCAECVCNRCRCLWRTARECDDPALCALLEEHLRACIATEGCLCDKG